MWQSPDHILYLVFVIKFLYFFLPYSEKRFKSVEPTVASESLLIVFFVKTNYNILPENNYVINKDDTLKRFEKGKVYQSKNSKPYITYSHLLDLITVMKKKENFNFFDYGAGNLDLFFYLNKKISNFNYFFHL